MQPVAMPRPRLFAQCFKCVFPELRCGCGRRRISVGRHKLLAQRLLQRLQLLARLESNRLPGRNGDFGARARIAPDAGLAWTHVEDSETTKLDALAAAQRSLHALENGLDGHLGLGFRDAGLVDYFVDDVQFNQSRLLVLPRIAETP